MSRHSSIGAVSNDPAFGHYDPDMDYMSVFRQIHESMDSAPIGRGNQKHTGIDAHTRSAWTETISSLPRQHKSTDSALPLIVDLQRQIVDLKSTVTSLENLDVIREKFAESESEDLSSIHQRTVDVAEKLFQDLPDLISDLKSDAETIATMQTALSDASIENNDLRQREAARTASLDVANDQIADLQRRLSTTEQEVTRLRPLSAKSIHLQEERKKLVADLSSIRNTLQDRDYTIATLRSDCRETDVKFHQVTADNQILSEKLRRSVTEANAIKQQRDALQNVANTAQEELEHVRSEHLISTLNLRSNRSEMLVRARRLRDNREECRRVLSDLHRTRRMYDQQSREHLQLSQHQQTIQQELRETQAQVDLLKAQSESDNKAWIDERSRLRARIEAVQEDLNQITSQCATVNMARDTEVALNSNYRRAVRALTYGEHIDFDKLEQSWQNVLEISSKLYLRATQRPLCKIHGLTVSSSSNASAEMLATKLLVLVHTTTCQHSVAQIQELADIVAQCDNQTRQFVLSSLYEFIRCKRSRIQSAVASVQTSMILLLSVELLSTWVEPDCMLYCDLASSVLADNSVLDSGPLVRALVDYLQGRLQGSNIALTDSLLSQTSLNVDRATHDGYVFVREVQALIVITPQRNVVYARPSCFRFNCSLEDAFGNPTLMPHPVWHIAFHECPLLGSWRTSWWDNSSFVQSGQVFDPFLTPEHGTAPEDFLLQEV